MTQRKMSWGKGEWTHLAPDGTKFTFRLNYAWRWRDLIPSAWFLVKWILGCWRDRGEGARDIARLLVALALVAREASQERLRGEG